MHLHKVIDPHGSAATVPLITLPHGSVTAVPSTKGTGQNIMMSTPTTFVLLKKKKK